MTKKQFFKTLQKNIKNIPIDEQQNAIEFYKEYFEDAESDEEALNSLDSPEIISSKLVSEFGICKDGKSKKSISPWAILLLTVAFPILIPLLMLLFCLILMIAIIGLVFAILCLIPFMISHIMLCIFGYAVIPAFIHDFYSGLVILGGFLVTLSMIGLFWSLVSKKFRNIILSTDNEVLKKFSKVFEKNDNFFKKDE